MCLIKCLLVSLLCLIAGSRPLPSRAAAETSVIPIALSSTLAPHPSLLATFSSLKGRDRSTISDIDMGLMVFLAAGLVALQLRREQKRARRNKLSGQLTFTVHPIDRFVRSEGDVR